MAAVLLPLAAPASAHRVEKHFAVEPHAVVTVQNPNGRIEVKSWKKPEVLIVGNHASDKVEVDTEQAGNFITVITHVLTATPQAADLQADYAITVPEETELQVRTDSGSIVVERVSGNMTFDTIAADVHLQEVGGYLVIKTVGGSVVCVRCSGRVEVNSISGDVKILEPQLNSARVQTSSGNIFFDGNFLLGGMYILKNYSGLIEVSFRNSDSFDLSATSMRGSVENEANLKPHAHERRETLPKFSKSVFGTFNEGHAKVELSSFSGTIKIRKLD